MAQRLNRLGIKTIKALSIGKDGKCVFDIPDPVMAARELARTDIAALLVDSYTGSRPGGTGVTVDLSIYQKIRKGMHLPLILAGGLTPESVLPVIQEARPYAVDVLTGVEERPGKKDPKKVYRFIRNIRGFDYKI